MPLIVRDARPEDCEVIAQFNNAIAEETENHSLDPAIIRSGVAALLADPTKGRYWLAESDGVVSGQIMITNEWSDWRDGMFWWIQSVYVHKDFRRTGVFSTLYRHVESLAQASEGVIGIRLYMDETNNRAQATYESLGLDMTAYRIMETTF